MQKPIRSSDSDAAGANGFERSVLVLESLSAPECIRVLDAFARLALGAFFEIDALQGCGALVAELQARYGGRFYWWSLKRGPRRSRAILAKPALGAPETVGGATAQMRSEHREIGRILDEPDALVTASDCATILQMFDRPVDPAAPFNQHCRREQAALYPLMDKVFDPAEERELLSLIQAFEI